MVRINAILAEDIIKKLDDIAKNEQKSRSMLLREAAEKLVEEHQRRLEEINRKRRIRDAIGAQDRLRKKSGRWNGVSELRKWREMAR